MFLQVVSSYNAELIHSQIFKSREDYVTDVCVRYYCDILYILNLYNNYVEPYTTFWLSECILWDSNFLNDDECVMDIIRKNNLVYGKDYIKYNDNMILSSSGLDKLFDGNYKGSKNYRDFKKIEYINNMYDNYYEELGNYGYGVINDNDEEYWSDEEY